MGLFSKPDPPTYQYWYLDDDGQFKEYGRSEDYHEEPLLAKDLHGMVGFLANLSMILGKGNGTKTFPDNIRERYVYSEGAKAQAMANAAKPGMREGILKKFTQENNKSIMMREAIRNQISKGAE